jgi:small multidrug resistance pump
VVYAIWSGVGIVLISLLGWLVYRERLDAAAMGGITLICLGVLVIQLFSHSSAH